jgi:membrane protease YdiL (CAAX protease family)
MSAETTPAAGPVARAGEDSRRLTWGLVPSALVAISAIPLFVFEERVIGYPILAAGLTVCAFVDRVLLRHLSLIGLGMLIISTRSMRAELGNADMVGFFVVLTSAIVVPYLISRFVFKENIIRFPVRSGQRWSRSEWTYLAVVLLLGYLILPIFFIRSEVYLNWPAVPTLDLVLRLFVGVNFVGLWDELFFICLVFALFRHHFPFWQANLLQAVIFTSFLWDIGYTYWGPFMTFPFALLQGYVFQRTKSLPFVVTIHLSFDFIIWMILVEAHNPGWFPIFLTD